MAKDKKGEARLKVRCRHCGEETELLISSSEEKDLPGRAWAG